MSDVSQGPGWWLASDGKWYAPELHPNAIQAPAPVGTQPLGARDDTASTPTSRVTNDQWFNQPQPHAQVAWEQSVRSELAQNRPLLIGGGVGLLVVAIAVILILSLSGGSGGGIGSASPTQVAVLTKAAVHRVGTVHVVTTFQTSSGPVTYVNDVANQSGKQVISGSGLYVSTVAVPGTVYVEANQRTLTQVFHAPPAVAQQVAGKWLKVPSSDPAYRQIAETLTLPSLMQQVMPTGSVTKLGPSTVQGQSVIGLEGELPGGVKGTLYIATTGSPLPVEELSTQSGTTATSTFSGWGETVSVTTPTEAIPGSSVGL